MAKAKAFGYNHTADLKVGANENQVMRNVSYLTMMDVCDQNS
jgi:hypothetical protein